jgi:hypothetical protein
MKSLRAYRDLTNLAIDILFILTICAQLVPVWFWTYFPSLDGPSHLYNASILLNYSKVPLYQQYYRITYDTPGNIVTQLVLSSLLTVLPPLVAEKTFLTLYLVSFPVAFRWTLQALGGDARSFSFFAVVLSYNHFLHLGFWNFCAGIPLTLATLAYISAGRERPLYGGRLATLLALALATYLCHPIAWGMAVLGTTWILAWEQFGVPSLKSVRPLPQRLLTAGAVVLPGLLYLFSTRVPGSLEVPRVSFSGAAQSLYQLGFLNSYGRSELWLCRTLLASVVVLIVFVALIGGLRQFKNPMLSLALACAALVAFGPDAFGTLLLIRERVAIFAFLFLCAGLATIDWPKKTPPVVLAVFLSVLSLIGTWRRQPAYKNWNARLAEYAAIAPLIQANSVLLTFSYATPEEHSSPTVHAAGNWTPKPFIDLSNFEARDVIFPVRFRNMRSPQADIYAPLSAYIERLRLEQFQLDYILFDAEPARLMRPEELERSSGILKEFALDYASPAGGHLRLYRRLKHGPGE